MDRPQQTPSPGVHLLRLRGDVLHVELRLPAPAAGQAWLRTNIGRSHIRRGEIITHVEDRRPILARDWHDVPMTRVDDARFSLSLPLLEVGRFEAKACFLAAGEEQPQWPTGENTVIKVEPADTACCNTVYTAFVRQFGPNQARPAPGPDEQAMVDALDRQGYTVIPRSGTFRDLVKELDFIVDELGFRILQLLPIHPVPTTFGRMGRFGSPFAALDLMDVDPALAEFDRHRTPMEQFGELVDAVHRHRARLFLDMPINHTGWASRLQVHHPEWFVRDAQQRFASPGAWGVTWEDLSELDYRHRGLWEHMAAVFRFWCERGVDGFRCDAGYMVPCPVWAYIVAKVREEFPDTVFLLEGLGGKAETQAALLDEGNLDWAYSELFQNYSRADIEAYLPACLETARTLGTLVNFAETHDNNRLAATGTHYARLRTALTALLAPAGAFGITNGVEWLAEEKVDVHGASSLNWGSDDNLTAHLARLTGILATHPACEAGAAIRLIQQGPGNALAVTRHRPGAGGGLLILANLDCDQETRIAWQWQDAPAASRDMVDLLSGRDVRLSSRGGEGQYRLAPAEVLCLTDSQTVARRPSLPGHAAMPDAVAHQEARAKALEVLAWCRGGDADVGDVDVARLATELLANPEAFCRRPAADTAPPYVSNWRSPTDLRRTVMVPPGALLLIHAGTGFSVELRQSGRVYGREYGLVAGNGRHFTVLCPHAAGMSPGAAELRLIWHGEGQSAHDHAPLRLLSPADALEAQQRVPPKLLPRWRTVGLSVNGRGAMALVRGAWGEVASKYDAMLAANLHPDYPVDRRILLTRCRGWLVNRGYSQTLNIDCLEDFSITDAEELLWRFRVPTGMGRIVRLAIRLSLLPGRNACRLHVQRAVAGTDPDALADDRPVRLILRPDLEHRNFHETTKAFTGPEHRWPKCVTTEVRSVVFAPSKEASLHMTASAGTFTEQPEWQYMVAHEEDRERGFEGQTDLFSPGYFAVMLRGGESMLMTSEVPAATPAPGSMESPSAPGSPDGTGAPIAVERALGVAMTQFVVKRDADATVIAGYPWFLDWGRDTLICLRGMIAAGHLDDAARILRQFARFEDQGTLPNMIRGDDNSNRDTSDAPLWFFVACNDFLDASGSDELLGADCGGRCLRDVLGSLAAGYVAGTPNGIRVDAASGLVYSPAHFTWMDTNHPAGTPRAGYPVEIQALWHAALGLLTRIDPQEGTWATLADRVRDSLHRDFVVQGQGFLADCLHAAPGTPAADAVPDDALRPNQLLAVTLGAISDLELGRRVVASCEELLVPGAIRSLADRPVTVPLPIRRHGQLLNAPLAPYWGRYEGDEDTRRKPAYHNGTAWTWMFPSFPEALYRVEGAAVRPAAAALLGSSVELLDQGCLGQVPEIVDGDAPHRQRGCSAQAWGVSELYRVWRLLQP